MSGCCPMSEVRICGSLSHECPSYYMLGNVGFIFTNGDLKETRTKILANRVAAPARAGAVAPDDVFVPAGNTGMEPGKTSFFQALGVPTKIARGTIEITTDLKLVEAGSKVGASEATLLNMLNISPFTYGMSITQVYEDGQTFSPNVLDIGQEQLLKSLNMAISTIASLSLATHFPTLPSVMHSLINSYKQTIAVALETEYSWDGITDLKDRIANPDAYASAAPVAAATETKEEKAAEKEESEKEESEDEGKDDKIPKIQVRKANHIQASVVSSTRQPAAIRWSIELAGLLSLKGGFRQIDNERAYSALRYLIVKLTTVWAHSTPFSTTVSLNPRSSLCFTPCSRKTTSF